MSDAPNPSPTPNKAPTSGAVQPKIVHRLTVRTLIGVIALGGILLGVGKWKEYAQDPNRIGSVDTVNYVAAVQIKGSGQQAVIIKPNGEILPSPEFKDTNTERDLAWQPDGHKLYYVSDREKQTFQVFRWRPIPGGESEPRTIGSRGKSNPAYAPGPDTEGTLLMTSGGTVLELDPVKRAMRQVLPPSQKEVPMGTGDPEEGAAMGPLGAKYGKLGESFRKARFIPNRQQVVAIMRRDRGEVLVVQDLVPVDGKLHDPLPIAAGDRMDFDIAENGTVVFSAQGFQWPDAPPAQFIKKGRVTFPFRHFVGLYKPEKHETLAVGASNDDKTAFGSVAISPQGDRILAVAGSYDGTSLQPAVLLIMPAQENSMKAMAPVARGEVFEPSWFPSGRQIVYVRRDGSSRSIFTANDDGSNEKNITSGKGDFGFPKVSPQLPPTK